VVGGEPLAFFAQSAFYPASNKYFGLSMIQRPVPWPNKAKVAVAITFDMDADSLVHVSHPRDSISRVSTLSMLKYGPEVAVPRILEGYRRFGLKQSARLVHRALP
jgi:hypothetical protein